jgi:hypothetical protein
MNLYVRPGEPIRAEAWNALIDALALAGTEIFPGPGLRRRVLGGKVILSAQGRPPRPSPAPFQVFAANDEDGAKVSVHPGTVRFPSGPSVVPTIEVGGAPVALDNDPAPTLAVEDGWHVYLRADVLGQTVTVEAAASVPIEELDEESNEVLFTHLDLATVAVDDAVARVAHQWVTGSQAFVIADAGVWGVQ